VSPSEQSLDDAVVQLMRDVACQDADDYLNQYLFPVWREVVGDSGESWHTRLSSFAPALRLILRHYALGHRRFSRLGASDAAEQAIRWAERLGANRFLREGNADPFVRQFVDALTPKGKRASSQLECLVRGLIEWNFDTYRASGEESLVAWVLGEIEETGRVEHVHQLLREISGFGPKAASRLLRDLVLVFQLEERIHPADRYLLQTVGAGIRRVAAKILPDEGDRRLPDWVLAGKVSKACRMAGVSGVRFNAGAEWRFGILAGETSDD
jgi:hypothetical protein